MEVPTLTYASDLVALDFLAVDEVTWWRTSFESLDSLKISRGEVAPHSIHSGWVSTVQNSDWLKERHGYEKENYGDSYNFGGDVDEMLQEFDHYVFRFHDEFVEVIAKGVWFAPLDGWTPERTPLADLSDSTCVEKREAHGIKYQVRVNPRPIEQLIKDSSLCSQFLMQFAAELDGEASVSWSVTLQTKDDQTVSRLRNYFGNAEKSYQGVAQLEQVRPHIENWLRDVQKRRRDMGKD